MHLEVRKKFNRDINIPFYKIHEILLRDRDHPADIYVIFPRKER